MKAESDDESIGPKEDNEQFQNWAAVDRSLKWKRKHS